MKAERIMDADTMGRVQAAMQGDGGHNVPCVTHALIGDDGTIWGAFSVVYAPALFFWMDARKGTGIASLRGLRAAQAEFRKLGHRRILLPIQSDSPYYPFVRSLGFELIGPCELFEFNPPQ